MAKTRLDGAALWHPEDGLVAQLIGQGYTRAAVTDEESMLANLKAQLTH